MPFALSVHHRLINSLTATLVALAAVAAPVAATAGQTTIELTEHVGQNWHDELVGFAFEAASGECDERSLRAEGPAGPVPVQLTDVTYWPDSKFVKSARLWMVTDLAPLSHRTYEVSYSPSEDPKPQPESDLKVVSRDGICEMETERFGVRMLIGEKTYDKPMAAAEVPGPVAGIRLSGGTWCGGGRMYGSTPITGYTATVIDAGPVLARVQVRYTYADGNVSTVICRLAARACEARWTATSSQEQPKDGWLLDVSSKSPPLVWRMQREMGGVPSFLAAATKKNGDWANLPLSTFKDKQTLVALAPWADWWDNATTHLMRLKIGSPDSVRELHIRRWDAGVWIDPEPLGHVQPLGKWRSRCIPIERIGDAVVMRVNNAKGMRRWRIGECEPIDEKSWRGTWMAKGGGQVLTELPDLDTVKNYVLDWQESDGGRHPRLFLSKEQYATRLANEPPPTRGIAMLRERLAALGDFDKFRHAASVPGLYDMLITSKVISPDERKLLRAQAAYLAYNEAGVSTWSAERGYCSANFNMSVSHGLTPGLFAALFPDHPMAKTWSNDTSARLRYWLDTVVGPAGEFPEGMHYMQVSASMMLAYAIAAHQAGFENFFEGDDPPLLRMGMFLAKQYQPPDPMVNNLSISPPVGRGSGDTGGLFGVFAQATAAARPEFSRAMQWAWAQASYSLNLPDDRMGGQETIYTDRNLPAQAPKWPLSRFDRLNVVLRYGEGTDAHHYVNQVTNTSKNVDVWAPEFGNIASWFAYGKPIGAAFPVGYEDRHELLKSGVVPARNYKAGSVAVPLGRFGRTRSLTTVDLPRLAYVHFDASLNGADKRNWTPAKLPTTPPVPKAAGNAPIRWNRQLLQIKGPTSQDPCYLVVRDTVGGGEPTMWQFWTYSRQLAPPGTPAPAGKTPDAPTATQPLTGDRFTALGQTGVDLEYFVASPSDTPRHTMGYANRAFVKGPSWVTRYQQMLHLQMPGDGHYFVAMFPRLHADAAPTFDTLGDGRVLRIAGEFGRDYVFVSDVPTEAEADTCAFKGVAGVVQDRKGGVVLSLSAEGEVRYGDCALTSPAAAELFVGDGTAEVTTRSAAASDAYEILVTLPGTWRADGTDGVEMTRLDNGTYRLQVPAEARQIPLRQTGR